MNRGTSELGQLAERIAKDYNLPKSTEKGVIVSRSPVTVLHGTNFRLEHGINSDDQLERLGYSDKVAFFVVYSDLDLKYVVKGRYVNGQKQILTKTQLGQKILAQLENKIAQHDLAQGKISECQLVADESAENINAIYDLVKTHILG